MTERIRDLKILAQMLYDRGLEGRRCVLLPETACFVGAALKVSDRCPTRDEVLAIICNGQCHDGRCQPCMNKANIITNAFRESGSQILTSSIYRRYLAKFPLDWMRRADEGGIAYGETPTNGHSPSGA